MNTTLARQWRSLSSGTPGRRFRDRYHRNQRDKNQHWLGRVLRVVFAAAAFTAGIVLTVIPGPATPLFFISGALIAADWLWMARVMDRLEVWLRKVFKPVAKFWLRLPSTPACSSRSPPRRSPSQCRSRCTG
ncbi:MAG: hypothetical protein WDM96_18390 [Lacunisphaera sp.]